MRLTVLKTLIVSSLFVVASITGQTKLKVKLEEITNDSDALLVLSIGKKNYFLAPDADFNIDMTIPLVAYADDTTPKSLPQFKNQQPITIKEMNPVTKQMTTLYELSIAAFIKKIGQDRVLQVSAQLTPTDTNRAMLEWTELLATDKETTLKIELEFEKVNGLVVHKGDSLDIDVKQED